MSNRTSVLVLVGAVASCLLLAVCVAVVGGSYYYLNNGTNPLAVLNAPASLNRIAFVGNDFNIYVADPTNGTTLALTKDGGPDHVYNFPTWSPDNHRLAFVEYTFQDGTPKEGALYTISPAGEKLTPLYKTPENFPFYLYWSPDSQLVSFLANKDSQNIALRLARADQADSMQEVDTGAPFYWAWSPDSSQMFTHVGGTRASNNEARLAMLAPKENETRHPLEAAPGEFQAPQWSSTGSILYSTEAGSEQAIALSDALGKETKKLVSYSGRASFALAPDGKQVAYILTEESTRLPHLGPVRVIDASGENIRVVSQDPALAFLWSPDSSKLAYVTVTIVQNQSNFNFDLLSPIAATKPEKFPGSPRVAQGSAQSLQLNWRVWDRAADTSRTLATFVPTTSFLSILPYFDQYANSSTFWSPDSQSFVYTARETEDTGAVFVADAAGTNPPRKVGDGLIAFWSWK